MRLRVQALVVHLGKQSRDLNLFSQNKFTDDNLSTLLSDITFLLSKLLQQLGGSKFSLLTASLLIKDAGAEDSNSSSWIVGRLITGRWRLLPDLTNLLLRRATLAAEQGGELPPDLAVVVCKHLTLHFMSDPPVLISSLTARLRRLCGRLLACSRFTFCLLSNSNVLVTSAVLLFSPTASTVRSSACSTRLTAWVRANVHNLDARSILVAGRYSTIS